MQPIEKQYGEMKVKGGLLRARQLYAGLNHGPAHWTRILERLAPEDQKILSAISVDDWYGLDLLDRLDHAIALELGEETGGRHEEVFEKLGEYSATQSLSGPFSSLLNPDIHAFLSQTALIHRTYQNFGSARYEVLSEAAGLLIIQYQTPPPASFCISGQAYFRRAIEMCGARSALVTHTRCCNRGDAVCEFYVHWQA